MGTRRSVRSMMVGCMGAVLAVTASAGAVGAATRYVDDDGKAGPAGCGSSAPAYRRVQAAIDASGPGDAIRVCPGTYTEALVVRGTGFGASPSCRLTIRGVGGRRPVLRAPRRLPANRHGALLVVRDLPDACDGHLRLIGVRLRPHGGTGDCGLTTLIEAFDAGLRVRDAILSAPLGDPTGCNTYHTGIRFERRGHGGTRSVLRVRGTTVRNFQLTGIDAGPGLGSVRIVSNLLEQTQPASQQGTPVGIQSGARGAVRSTTIRSVSGPVAGIHSRGSLRIEETFLDRVDWGIRSAGSDEIVRNVLVGAPDPWGHGIRVTAHRGDRQGRILDNIVSHFGRRGLLVVPPSSGSPGHLVIRRNSLNGNGGIDCTDRTKGSRTAGTASTWVGNIGDESRPAGLCTPARAGG